MRAFLHVGSGPLAGRRVPLRAGEPLRVGRGARADVVVSTDERLADVHFELSWDGATCRLRDVGRRGTHVDGKAVEDGPARDGASILAGTTGFLLRLLPDDLRARLPLPPAHWKPPTEAILAAREAALSALRAEAAPLFAILDAARDRRIRPLLQAAEEESRSLYEGPKGDLLAPAAPYLVPLAATSELCEVIVREGWADAWGVFLTSRRPFAEVRQRLRRSLMVNDEETNQRLYFRFYDPRVLALFWPAATARQRSEMLGTEIDAFLIEGEGGAVVRLGKDG